MQKPSMQDWHSYRSESADGGGIPLSSAPTGDRHPDGSYWHQGSEHSNLVQRTMAATHATSAGQRPEAYAPSGLVAPDSNQSSVNPTSPPYLYSPDTLSNFSPTFSESHVQEHHHAPGGRKDWQPSGFYDWAPQTAYEAGQKVMHAQSAPGVEYDDSSRGSQTPPIPHSHHSSYVGPPIASSSRYAFQSRPSRSVSQIGYLPPGVAYSNVPVVSSQPPYERGPRRFSDSPYPHPYVSFTSTPSSYPPHHLATRSLPSNVGPPSFHDGLALGPSHTSSSSMYPSPVPSPPLPSISGNSTSPTIDDDNSSSSTVNDSSLLRPSSSSASTTTQTTTTSRQQSSGQSRPHQCDQCPLSFQRNHDLKRHKRIHLEVKPYPCPGCSKRFTRRDALKRHLLVKQHASPSTSSISSSSSTSSSTSHARSVSEFETTFERDGNGGGSYMSDLVGAAGGAGQFGGSREHHQAIPYGMPTASSYPAYMVAAAPSGFPGWR